MTGLNFRRHGVSINLWVLGFVLAFAIFRMSCNALRAQSILKKGLWLQKEDKAGAPQAVREIETSREMHEEAHNEELEMQHAERAVEISLSIGDTLLYARALDNLGLLYRFHRRYEEAIPLHVKALSFVQDLDDAPLPNMIYANNAGVACRYAQKYAKAVLYYMHALKVAEQQEDLRNIAISCNGLGNTLLHIPHREEDAILYFERALKTEKERGNPLGVAMNYLSISDYYNEKGEYLKARDYLEKLLKINQERNDIYGLAITYQFYGLNYLREGKDLKKSKAYYLKSLDLFTELENKVKQAELWMYLGEIERLGHHDKQALAYYNQSLTLAKNTQNKGLLMGLYYQLSNIYEKRGDLAKALTFYKTAQQYKDSVALKEQKTQIAAIEKRYALEKKESRIALLEKDKMLQQTTLEHQEATMRNQKFTLIILFVGLLAIGVIAMMQYRNIKIKKNSNKLLLQRNQQIISQRDEIAVQKDKIEKVNEQLEAAFEEIIEQQKKNEEKRIKLIESRFENKIQSLTLESLESQMNPHFLFNGMNAVRWLVVKDKKKEAMVYLNTFAQLLRMSLTNNRKNEIPLEEELKTTDLYLEIEKLRFNSEFVFSVNIAPDIDVTKIIVPPRILQPLAENAVKHGLLPSQKPDKKIEINVVERGDAICIEVIDNGMGIKKAPLENAAPKQNGAHLGLKLIRERLSIYNEQNENLILFKIEPYKNDLKQVEGTKAGIRIIKKKVVELATL